jgi:DNA-binding protein HU-beta
VNKAQLIEALANRLGDKRAASAALDAVLAEIQAAVTKGDRVAITGFGAFEKRVRGARTARNPRTGEAVKVKKTSVPAFRAGAGFKEMVASGKVPKVAAAKKTATKTATKAAAKTTSARATKSTAAKSTAKSTAKKAPAKKTTAKAAKTTRAATTRATGRTTTTAKAPAAKRAPATKKR